MTRRDLGRPYRDPRWSPRPPERGEPSRRASRILSRGPRADPPAATHPLADHSGLALALGTRLLTVAALLVWGGWLTTGAWVLVIAPVVVSSLILIDPCQMLLARRFFSAIAVQHRLRVGCSTAALHGPDGELPAVLWTQVTDLGERVHLWTSPAVTIEDFRTERKRLADACRANTVRVSRHPRFAQVMVLDVVRRGPDEIQLQENAAIRRIPRQRQRQEV